MSRLADFWLGLPVTTSPGTGLRLGRSSRRQRRETDWTSTGGGRAIATDPPHTPTPPPLIPAEAQEYVGAATGTGCGLGQPEAADDQHWDGQLEGVAQEDWCDRG